MTSEHHAPDAVPGADDDILVDKVMTYFLWCDQGMANYVEIYKKGGNRFVPDKILLIDFGASSVRTSPDLSETFAPPVFTILGRLDEMMRLGRPPVIDMLVISHQDNDHWSLIRVLVDQAKVDKIPLQFGQVRWGGLRWGSNPSGLLKDLAPITVDGVAGIVPWEGVYSDYTTTPAPAKGALFTYGDVALRTLVVNCPSASNTDKAVRNTSGAILVIEFGANGTYVLPGDATAETMAWATGQIERYLAASGTNPVRPCFALSAPHHGSRETTIDANGTDYTIAKAFTESVQPYTLVASAGARNTYAHPHHDVLEIFGKYVGEKGPRQRTHPIVFTNGVKRVYDQILTGRDIYTTIIDVYDDPIWAANYVCAMYGNNQVETIAVPFKVATSGDEYVPYMAYERGNRPIGPTPPPAEPPPIGLSTLTGRARPAAKRVTARRTGGKA